MDIQLHRGTVAVERIRCIRRLAKLLIVNIRRTEYHPQRPSGVKNVRRIVCNKEIDLNCLMYKSDGTRDAPNDLYPHFHSSEEEPGPFVYQLYGFLIHKGTYEMDSSGERYVSGSGGHYMALVKGASNSWQLIDDQQAVPVQTFHNERHYRSYFGGINCVDGDVCAERL